MPLNPLLRQGTRAVTNSLTSHRLLLYGAVSTIAVCAAVANALRNYTNFYSVAIYLSRSSSSVLIFANFGFILALLFGHIVQRIFFGPLRANEVERLYDRLWIFVTESLLAFTIFRDEFDAPFALMFGSLLFIKSFHWLASDRIEWMDQQPYPGPSVLFHVRMSTLFLILWLADLSMLLFAVENTLSYGVGGMVLFACEYGILLATAANIIAKYALSCYDFHRAGTRGGENAPPWEQKSIWTFYFELVTDFSKLTTYLCFFTIILTFYGLPLNIVRDIYFTARSFVTRLKALRRYQTATRNMDERYPNATPEEMAESDHTCIICREEMVLPAHDQPTTEGPNTTPKKLPCGHIFHFHCLRSWLERQQSCPTCRRTVLETTPPNRAVAVPRQAAQAAPPAPAGTPAPNPHPAPGAQNANAGHGNANNAPMDLIRRLVNNNNNNQLQNRGNGANGALNVIIQYDIHNYGPGGRPEPRVAATSSAPLRRPQQFAGFQGPGGVWQPWNIDGVELPNQEVGTGGADTPAASTSQPTPTTPLDTAPESTPHAPETTVTSPDLTETQPDAATSAREAAAQAALRRFNSSSSSSNSGAESSRQPIPPTSTPPPSTETSSSSIPPTSSNGDVPIPHTDTPTVPAPTPIPGGIKLPAFIPLDLNPNLSRRDLPRNPLRVQRPQRPPPSLSQLPPVTTPEQLAMMDRVTREAIDERLRVLEGVSGAVYRCIDELMKMRSTLPAPTAAPVAAPAQNVAEGSSSSAAPISTPTVTEHIVEPGAGQPAVEDERQEQEQEQEVV